MQNTMLLEHRQAMLCLMHYSLAVWHTRTMPQERKTIGFSSSELKLITHLLEGASKPRVLQGVTTLSDAIRRLTKIGLQQVTAMHLSERYRAAAAEARELYTPPRSASANLSSTQALHTS